jgi:hypothetical protein
MKAATITVLLMATCLFSEGADRKQRKQRDYPLAIEVVETQSVENAHDLARVKASDGNLYTISCPGVTGLLLGLVGDPHCWDVTLVPGTIYRARWNRGDLTVSVSADDKSGARLREATFTVDRSNKMTSDEMLNCRVCVIDAPAKGNGPAVSQNAPQQVPPAASAAAAQREDSWDTLASASEAWKAGLNCGEHMNFMQCRAQVEAAKPALEQVHLEWQKLKNSAQQQAADPGTSRECQVIANDALARFDHYLLIQDKLVAMFESVDPNALNAQSTWNAASAKYQQLRHEESQLGDFSHLGETLQTACPE